MRRFQALEKVETFPERPSKDEAVYIYRGIEYSK